MKVMKDIRENFYKNTGATKTSIKKISEMLEKSYKDFYEWDCVNSSDLTDYIPGLKFEFLPEKSCMRVYSELYPKICYNFNISDFIEEVMLENTDDESFILTYLTVVKNKKLLRLALEFGDSVRKVYLLPLQNSPFVDIREMTEWIKEFLEVYGTGGRARVKCDKTTGDVKQIFKKIAGEL